MAVALAVLTLGCTILDPGDRAELNKQISMMPPSDVSLLKRMAMNAKAMEFLRGKSEKEKMGKLECRLQANGQWTGWNDQEPVVHGRRHDRMPLYRRSRGDLYDV